MKLRPVEAELFRAEGRWTARHDEVKGRYSQFCERARLTPHHQKKKSSWKY